MKRNIQVSTGAMRNSLRQDCVRLAPRGIIQLGAIAFKELLAKISHQDYEFISSRLASHQKALYKATIDHYGSDKLSLHSFRTRVEMYTLNMSDDIPHQCFSFLDLKKLIAYMCYDYHIPFTACPFGTELAESHVGFPMNYLLRIRDIRTERPFVLSKIEYQEEGDDDFRLIEVGQYSHLGNLFSVLSSQYRGKLVLSHPSKGYFEIVTDRVAPLIPYAKSLVDSWGQQARQGLYVHRLGQGVVTGIIKYGKHSNINHSKTIPVPSLQKVENRLLFQEVSSV